MLSHARASGIARRPTDWLIWAWMGLMSLVYTLAMFRGLEVHAGYFGNAYQALHPGSFPRDLYMAPGRPTMLSLYYVLVKLVGPLWLDDRVAGLIFLGVALLALLGLDRTAQLFGARRIEERLAILSLMLLEHRVWNNHALLIDNYGFNPTALAVPAITWLLYASLAALRPWLILSLMGVALLTSIKSAWLPSLIALALLWHRAPLPRRWRLGSLGLAGLLLLIGLAIASRTLGADRVALFDYVLRGIDRSEANPFWNPLLGNALFVALCLMAFRLTSLPQAVLARVKIVAWIGLLAWGFGGAYLSWTPDALKIPWLVPLDVTRALWWSKYVLYVAFGVALLKWLQRSSSWGGCLAAWGTLLALALLHLVFRAKLAVLFIGISVAMWWWHARSSGRQLPDPSTRLRIVATAMTLGILALYSVGTLHHRVPALRTLLREGIMGDAPGATWIGVNEYLRAHTPPSATVLSLSLEDVEAPAEPRLRYDGSLRVRGGRPMPLGHPSAMYFDYAKLQEDQARTRHMNALVEAWEAKDRQKVLARLAALGWPDYLVVPTSRTGWLAPMTAWDYQEEAVVRTFTILHRVEPAQAAPLGKMVRANVPVAR